MKKGKELDTNIGSMQEPATLCLEVARAIHQTASRKATGPNEVPAELFKAGEIVTLRDFSENLFVP